MEQQDIAEEVVLYFARFPAEKQEQVRGLVNYSTLMGLDGKDLMSIGGKLERIRKKQEQTRNRQTIELMDIRRVGKDISCRNRWDYTDSTGTLYHFDLTGNYYRHVKITNVKSKMLATMHMPEHYDFGRGYHYDGNWDLPEIMLNVYYGKIALP
jgi:hypothetical protein